MKNSSILVVDDNLFMRSLLRGILSKSGFRNVHEARSGEEAMEAVPKIQPALVTLDIVMPKINGLKTLKRIMSLKSDCRVVMCSALGQEALIIEALENGAKDFITKPFKPLQVIRVVERLLGDRPR